MPAGENATGLPEMTESSPRAVRCGGNRTRSPDFYLELLSCQEIPACAPIVLQEAHHNAKLLLWKIGEIRRNYRLGRIADGQRVAGQCAALPWLKVVSKWRGQRGLCRLNDPDWVGPGGLRPGAPLPPLWVDFGRSAFDELIKIGHSSDDLVCGGFRTPAEVMPPRAPGRRPESSTGGEQDASRPILGRPADFGLATVRPTSKQAALLLHACWSAQSANIGIKWQALARPLCVGTVDHLH
jgi:hypothetical protein